MVFRHFRLICASRVLALGATIFLLCYSLFHFESYAAASLLAVLCLYQIHGLIYYLERICRDLTRFLLAIKYEDFSQTFSAKGLGKSFCEFRGACMEVLATLKETRADREQHGRFVQAIIQHIDIAVMAFHRNGEIKLSNNAARRLFRVSQLRNIRQLETYSKDLVSEFFRLGRRSKIFVEVVDSGRLVQLVISTARLKIRGEMLTIASIQDFQAELEQSEIDAWQNLISVLTHEIMNSITPISSLASTLRSMILPTGQTSNRKDSNLIDDTIFKDVSDGIVTIEERSKGLLNFVEAYRNLSRLPKPNIQIFPVRDLFGRLEQLILSEHTEESFDFQICVDPETLELTADPQLIEQALLNIIRNAIQALVGHPEPLVKLVATMDQRGRPLLQVSDNGPGIEEGIQKKIFVPFFSTKKNGSGIGLSLCKQIMSMHRSTITVDSLPGEGTIVSLSF